jgi:hypothetical protein
MKKALMKDVIQSNTVKQAAERIVFTKSKMTTEANRSIYQMVPTD